MKKTNIAVEDLAIQEGSKHFYSAGNKTAAIPDSSVRRNSYNNRILNHKESSDEELIRRFMETQDEEAFNEIVDRYGDKIYRTALRITHNPNDAEDVLQEVFTKLIKNLHTLRGESKFSTWLYRVAVNESYIYLRTEKKYRSDINLEEYVSYDEDGVLKGVEMEDWNDKPDEVLINKETIQMIERAVDELPVAYRVVFHLRDVEGFTNHEVAEVLGLFIRCVASRVHRARLILRNKLSDYFYGKGNRK